MHSPNPFASPVHDAPYEGPATDSDPDDAHAEAIRREHIDHEARVKSAGSYFLLVALGFGFIGAPLLVLALRDRAGIGELAIFAFLAALGGFEGWVGVRIRALDGRVRTMATILAILGFVQIPIGTVINLYVLWVLHSAKGRYIFTPEYQQIIARTPHVKRKTPWLTIAFLALIIASTGGYVFYSIP